MKKALKAKRSCKPEDLMNTEFLYSGPLRKIGFRYSRPPWVFVTVALFLAIIGWKTLW